MLSLGKTRWPVVVVVVVLAAVFGSLGAVQARQSAEKTRLEQEISALEENITEDLQQRSQRDSSTETSAELEAAKAQLSIQTDSIDANEALFEIARRYGVMVTETMVANESAADLAGVTCSTLPVTVSVEGEVLQLVEFIMALNTEVPNGLVGEARASVPSASSDALPWADVSLAIYSYQGE